MGPRRAPAASSPAKSKDLRLLSRGAGPGAPPLCEAAHSARAPQEAELRGGPGGCGGGQRSPSLGDGPSHGKPLAAPRRVSRAPGKSPGMTAGREAEGRNARGLPCAKLLAVLTFNCVVTVEAARPPPWDSGEGRTSLERLVFQCV